MDITTLTMVTVALSLIASFIKHLSGSSGQKAQWIVIGLSLVFGLIYHFAKDTVMWQTVLAIIGYANLVYLVFMKFVDKGIEKAIVSGLPPQE